MQDEVNKADDVVYSISNKMNSVNVRKVPKNPSDLNHGNKFPVI